MTKRHLNIRIPDGLWKKIEESGQKHTEIVTVALTQYFSSTRDTSTTEGNTSSITGIEHLRAILQSREELVRTLQSENGFLITEFQRLSRMNEQLLLSPAPEEITKKSW
jgi:hypothetical protein